MSLLAVMTTIDDAGRAAEIARQLIDRKLAACVQMSEIDSVYSWEGEIRSDKEFRLLIKTTRAKYDEVETLIRELHTYDLPAVFAVDVSEASDEYAKWVESCCR